MTRHLRLSLLTIIRSLRPSPASIAAAAAVSDPGLLLQLEASERERA